MNSLLSNSVFKNYKKAVFCGYDKSGKSSLINTILGQNLTPFGVDKETNEIVLIINKEIDIPTLY